MVPLNIVKNDNILIIAPHPDDECIGVGGVLTTYANQVEVWLLTNGYYGKSNGEDKSIVNVRKNEFCSEMGMLGITNYRIFELEDGTLTQKQHFLDDISLNSYTKIFVPNQQDNHLDHVSAFRMIANALCYQNIADIELYQYEVTTPLTYATHYLDISRNMEKKMECISLHKSQLQLYDYCGIASHLNAYRAKINGIKNGYHEVYRQTALPINKKENICADKLRADNQKYKLFVDVYDNWINVFLEERKFSDFFNNAGVNSVAIYGYGKLGKKLYRMLKKSGIEISYIIDKLMKSNVEFEVEIVTPENIPQEVDLIIVTAVYDYDNIVSELQELGYNQIISFERLLHQVNEM